MGRTRRLTRPGLGQDSGVQPRLRTSSPPKSGIVCPSPIAVERKSSDSIAFRPTEPPPPPAPRAPAPSQPDGMADSPNKTGKRQRQSIREDDVGVAASKFGAAAPLTARPRLVRSRKELEAAPIDHRAAFVLSLVDGKMTVASLVDIAAMPENEVLEILTKLRRLGIITYGPG